MAPIFAKQRRVRCLQLAISSKSIAAEAVGISCSASNQGRASPVADVVFAEFINVDAARLDNAVQNSHLTPCARKSSWRHSGGTCRFRIRNKIARLVRIAAGACQIALWRESGAVVAVCARFTSEFIRIRKLHRAVRRTVKAVHALCPSRVGHRRPVALVETRRALKGVLFDVQYEAVILRIELQGRPRNGK